jgi:hypothetical protein
MVTIAENWRQMLASQRANSLDIGKSNWPHLEINAFMLKRVPDAPGVWTRASAFVSNPFEEGQRHRKLRQQPLQSAFRTVALAVLYV